VYASGALCFCGSRYFEWQLSPDRASVSLSKSCHARVRNAPGSPYCVRIMGNTWHFHSGLEPSFWKTPRPLPTSHPPPSPATMRTRVLMTREICEHIHIQRPAPRTQPSASKTTSTSSYTRSGEVVYFGHTKNSLCLIGACHVKGILPRMRVRVRVNGSAVPVIFMDDDTAE